MSDTKNVLVGNLSGEGLGDFGISTILQQLHHIGVCSIGSVILCGLVFGEPWLSARSTD